MARKKANKGISRIDSGSTHGWFVRGYRNGKTYSKLFSDRKCGGKNKALSLARDYQEELSAELEAIPKNPRKRRIVLSDSRNNTGELGVSRTTKVDPNGGEHDCYSVSWRPEPGVQKCTSFSIRKYGEKKAFRLAVAHRRQKMREIHGPNFYRKLSKKKQSREKNS
ncbi:MAG: AP2 domain-containing protein [Opitutales bacterium]